MSRDSSLILNIDVIQLGLNIKPSSSDTPVSIDDVNTILGFIGHIQYFSHNGVVLLANTGSPGLFSVATSVCLFHPLQKLVEIGVP